MVLLRKKFGPLVERSFCVLFVLVRDSWSPFLMTTLLGVYEIDSCNSRALSLNCKAPTTKNRGFLRSFIRKSHLSPWSVLLLYMYHDYYPSVFLIYLKGCCEAIMLIVKYKWKTISKNSEDEPFKYWLKPMDLSVLGRKAYSHTSTHSKKLSKILLARDWLSSF